MIYKIIAGQDIFELNPGLRAVPGYQNLTDMQMKYICLVCDPSRDNPVRTLQGKARKEKAAMLAGYKLEAGGKRLEKNGRDIIAGNIKTIEEGLTLFKTLHYDERTDTYESLLSQIGEIRDFLKSKKENDPKKLRQAITLGVELPALIEAKLKIERLLNIDLNSKPELGPTYVAADFLPREEEPLPVEEDAEDGNTQQSLIDQVIKKE